MDNDVPPLSWKRSRYGFAAFWFASLLVGWAVLRLVLLLAFAPVASLPLINIFGAFLSGLHRDLFAASLATLPLLFWFLLLPERWGNKHEQQTDAKSAKPPRRNR